MSERNAEFPGGVKAMKEFLMDNIEYPEISMELGDYGQVVLEFVVNKDGSLEQIKVLSGVSREIDKEAIRVIGEMPNWIPAIHKGELVRARCKIPINFILEDDSNIVENPEKLAFFKKGEKGINKLIRKKLNSPLVISTNYKQADIIVEFVVNINGTTEQINITGVISEKLKRDLTRLIREMENWIPAMNEGKQVRSRFVLPLSFK